MKKATNERINITPTPAIVVVITVLTRSRVWMPKRKEKKKVSTLMKGNIRTEKMKELKLQGVQGSA